jgi:transcriptional regulator with XRE-family HTH domain
MFALTQSELSKRSNVKQATISQIENGSGNCTLETLGKLAEGMGMDLIVTLKPKKYFE